MSFETAIGKHTITVTTCATQLNPLSATKSLEK